MIHLHSSFLLPLRHVKLLGEHRIDRRPLQSLDSYRRQPPVLVEDTLPRNEERKIWISSLEMKRYKPMRELDMA